MNYLGSKGGSGVFQTIIGNMPPHSVYVEAFLGRGTILTSKRLAPDANVGIDVDGQTLNEFFIANGFLNPFDIRAGDALDILPTLDLPTDALIYCDPPYLRSTRTSRHCYRHEFDSPDCHEKLLALLQGLRCMVMLSGYPSKLYSERLASWRCVSYRTRTRGRTVTECLWCNFAEPDELHDWRFAGKNFRERLTLKRRADRLVRKLDALAPRHRGFVLDALEQRYFRRGGPATIVGKDVAR